MRITIVGAGNIGTQFAVHCAEAGHNVVIYGSKPNLISKQLTIVDQKNKIIHSGIIDLSTNDDFLAFNNSDLIFVTVPAFLMDDISKKIMPFVKKDLLIGLIPGTGGGECAFKKCVEKGATVFGLQRVPSVARLIEYGKIVEAVGYREKLHVSSIPRNNVQSIAKIISEIFGIPCESINDYLNLTLTPSNPILHTVRLYNIYKDYHKNTVYKKVPLFYEDWNDESSHLLFLCDEEVQKICRALPQFDLSYVKSLKDHYESYTEQEMTRKISSIEGFKGISTPSVKYNDGFLPDFDSRYFTADFSYGLSILVKVANLINIEVENMKTVLSWYQSLINVEKEFNFSKYNINNLSDFLKFYSL